MTTPGTEAGKRMLNIPAIRNSYSTAAWVEEICGVEAEATAAAEQRLRDEVQRLIEESGGTCVVPDDYSDDEINICATHSEILFGDTRTCEDDPRQLRAVLRALSTASGSPEKTT